ncbi:MAG: D-alanine--D-alanine ligase [Brevinematales bacterium]|nr:D-alanine--D-alanine ligase [Brevinematales bacterium]
MPNDGLDISRYTNKTIGVLMGGMSSEREISLRSGANVLRALQSLGLRAVQIDVGRDIASRLVSEKIDIAFIALHGTYGEDGCIQGLLEILGIPYTGSGVAASAIAMDKMLTKKIWSMSGVPVPGSVEIDAAHPDTSIRAVGEKLGYPVVLKPISEGSSVGVELVKSQDDLRAHIAEYSRKYRYSFAEQYISGKELTVGILDDGVSVTALPILELRPKNEFYDFEAKYTKGMTDFVIPAEIPAEATKNIQDTTKRAFSELGLKGFARIDVMLEPGGDFYYLEANSLPGLTDTSDIPAMAREVGMDMPQLAKKILDCVDIK